MSLGVCIWYVRKGYELRGVGGVGMCVCECCVLGKAS